MAEWLSAIGSLLAGLAALVAVDLARKQLINLNRTLRQTVVASVIQLETEMNSRKLQVAEAALKLLKLVENNSPSSEVGIANKHMEACLENWLNSCDRLAFLIVRRYVKESEWRTEYEAYFSTLISNHPNRFRPGTIYNNVCLLAKKWNIALPSS